MVNWDYASAGLVTAKVELGISRAVGWAKGMWEAIEDGWTGLFE